MKQTILYESHVKLGAKMVEFAGFMMPIQYEGIVAEHKQVREKAGLFDVSHMGEIIIEGVDAVRFLNHMVTNDIRDMLDNQIIYSPMCYEDGGCVDDLLIYRLKENKYLLVVNASNIGKDFEWLLTHKEESTVTISNQSETYGLIALQGPLAKSVLESVLKSDNNQMQNKLQEQKPQKNESENDKAQDIKLLDSEFKITHDKSLDLEKLAYYHFKQDVNVLGYNVLISRTGYTGEDGFEILGLSESINDIFNEFLTYDQVEPCGLGCRDTLRFEASMPLYGHELSKDINPLEAGLKRFIKLEKSFIGRDALVAYNLSNKKRKIVGVLLIEKGIIREGYKVYSDEDVLIGTITTGYKSPTLNKVLGLALIISDSAQLGDKVFVEIREKLVPALIIDKRFLKK